MTRRRLWLVLAAAFGIVTAVAISAFVASGGTRAAAEKVPVARGELAAKRIAKPAAAHRNAAPSARAFAHSFVSATNTYAASQGDPVRIGHADCVSASPGSYMCSYRASRPDGRSECRIMQAQWTPSRATPMTVTLAGRVKRCASLRDALRSLS